MYLHATFLERVTNSACRLTILWLLNCICLSFSMVWGLDVDLIVSLSSSVVCLCWGFTAQSTQWGHVERGQFT